MSQSRAVKINIAQNHPDFVLRPLTDEPPLFKFEYLRKVLDPIQEDPEDVRTYTIKYLVRNCK